MKKMRKVITLGAMMFGLFLCSAMAQHKPIKVRNVKGNPFKVVVGTPKPIAKRDMIYGHEYADLGLSVKWATSNIDANNAGGYYGRIVAWGEINEKNSYTPSTSVHYERSRGSISGDSNNDLARRVWGGKWRIPTVQEMRELREKCTWTWSRESGRNGYVVRSKINGNYIFLPAVGVNYNNGIKEMNVSGFYWTATPYNNTSSYRLQFSKGSINVNWGSRYEGYYIRAVCD